MNILIHGTGAMGSIVRELVEADHELELSGFADDFTEENGDVIIDFSHFSRLQSLLDYGVKKNIPIVLCTTGYDEAILNKIEEASKRIPILISSNMSVGINLMNELMKVIVPALNNFDIEIVEKHHNKKIDSPSGTAKKFFDIIKKSSPKDMKAKYGREGISKREDNEIGIHSVRGGSVVGEHSVIFYGDDEILEIKHTAMSKKIFANGAIKASKEIIKKGPGLYYMADIL